MELGESEEETTCAICCAEFLDADDLKRHVTQVHLTDTSRKRFCDFCTLAFCSIEDYVVHIRDAHVTSLECCKYCTRVFTNIQAFSDHQRKHKSVDGSLISCSQCRDTFNNVTDLENHEFQQHFDVKEGVMLHEYFSMLSSIINIKANTFLQSLHSGTVFVCIKCQHTTPDLKDYINHLKRSNCRSVTCDKCFNVYKSRRGMQRHLSYNVACSHVIKEEDLERYCKKCKTAIPVASYLEHVRACKPIKCSLCNLLYKSIQELQEHQTEMHPKAIFMTICKFCHKEFVGSVALQKHMTRIHNPQLHLYKYKCVHCEDRFFMHPQKLFAHLFSKHINFKPFTCKICDMQFRVRRKFTIHIKMAHDSKGFVEFDDQYNVFFTPTKSANPFIPKSLFEKPNDEQEDETGASETEAETDVQTDTEKKGKIEHVKTEKRFKICYKNQGRENAKSGPLTDKEKELQSDVNEMQSELEGDKTTQDGENASTVKSEVETRRTRKRKSVKDEIVTETEAEIKSEAETKEWGAKRKKSLRKIKKEIATETEAEKSDKESSAKKKRKFQKTLNKKELISNMKDLVCNDDSEATSEDESLIKIKKREKLKRLVRTHTAHIRKKGKKNFPKNKFTCSICNKYCYTFQNYHQHISLHFKDEVKKCIKCDKEFTSKTALIQHIRQDHNTSGLTQTLKNMLQRRKEQKQQPKQRKDLSTTQKFQNTIKKVYFTPNNAVAKITKMADDSNVKNFLESFIPEENTVQKTIPDIQTSVTIQTLDKPISRPSLIKMTKFEPKRYDINRNHGRKIALPVPFKEDYKENNKVKVNVTMVRNDRDKDNEYHDAQYDDGDHHQEDNYQDDHHVSETVPEVAVEQEVTVADTQEEKQFNVPHTLVLPKEYLTPQNKNKIRIAHMLPQKPYYKIIKMEDVLEVSEQEEEVKFKPGPIELPDGTKLVNVNPLAHLIGNTPIEKLIGKSKKNYYKSKRKCDVPTAIASAMLKIESKHEAKKGAKKKEVAQVTVEQ